jgi:hypothetical protein
MLMLQPKTGRSTSSQREGDGERTDYLKEREGDFLIVEFGKLQDEILHAPQEKWRAEQTVLLLNVLLLAIASLTPVPIHRLYYGLPFLITLLGGMRALMVWLHIKRVGNYLTKVEEVFGVHPRLGWELRLQKLDESKPYTLALVGFSLIFWLGLLGASFVLAIGFQMRIWPGV